MNHESLCIIGDQPETCNAHQGTIESQQSTGLHHMLLSQARIPREGLLFYITINWQMCARRVWQDGNQL